MSNQSKDNERITNRKSNEYIKIFPKFNSFTLVNKRLNLYQSEKYKDIKHGINNKIKKKMPNIKIYFNNSKQLEDEFIYKDKIFNKKYKYISKKEKPILSFPQIFKLNSNKTNQLEENKKNSFELFENKKTKFRKININNNLNFNSFNSSKIQSAKYNKEYSNMKFISIKNDYNNYDNSFRKKNSSYKNKSMENYINKETNILNNKNKNIKNIIDNIKQFGNKITEKYEIMRKRKELVILNRRKIMNLMKEKSENEYLKKLQGRLKIKNDKKYIENIIPKLKNNYIKTNKNNNVYENKNDNNLIKINDK